MKKSKLPVLGICAALALSLFAGCSAASADFDETAVPLADGAVGRVVVSVNPEVAVDYDENAEVVGVEGLNGDGEQISGELGEGYEGREVRVVVGEIVELIYRDGYFSTTVNGVEKNIVVRVEQGSQLPSDDFVEVIAGDVSVVVDQHGGSSTAVTVGLGDYNLEFSAQGYISLSKAEEIALAQGGAADTGEIVDKEYNVSDGMYEIEYLLNDKLIQANVDAVTGKVIAMAEKVLADVTGYKPAEAGTADDTADNTADGSTGNSSSASGQSPEDWGESIGDSWENWGESYGESWESWGESYGNSWESWGESVGDYFDHYWDF